MVDAAFAGLAGALVEGEDDELELPELPELLDESPEPDEPDPEPDDPEPDEPPPAAARLSVR